MTNHGKGWSEAELRVITDNISVEHLHKLLPERSENAVNIMREKVLGVFEEQKPSGLSDNASSVFRSDGERWSDTEDFLLRKALENNWPKARIEDYYNRSYRNVMLRMSKLAEKEDIRPSAALTEWMNGAERRY